jgi:hypothetical protein
MGGKVHPFDSFKSPNHTVRAGFRWSINRYLIGKPTFTTHLFQLPFLLLFPKRLLPAQLGREKQPENKQTNSTTVN